MTREETDPGIREAILDTSSRIGNARPAGTIPPTAGDVADEVLSRVLNGKSSKGSKALIALAGLLLGSGGIVGSYYATKALATKNAGTLDKHEERLDASEKAIGIIGDKVDDLDHTVGEIADGQKNIADGIDELKQESIDELKRELEAERRRNRRRDNGRDP